MLATLRLIIINLMGTFVFKERCLFRQKCKNPLPFDKADRAKTFQHHGQLHSVAVTVIHCSYRAVGLYCYTLVL